MARRRWPWEGTCGGLAGWTRSLVSKVLLSTGHWGQQDTPSTYLPRLSLPLPTVLPHPVGEEGAIPGVLSHLSPQSPPLPLRPGAGSC